MISYDKNMVYELLPFINVKLPSEMKVIGL